MAIARKKRKFFEVTIPLIETEIQILASDLKELEGRTINYDLTRMLKGKNALLNLLIKIQDNSAIAHPVSLKLMPYFLRKMIRKGTNYVEDSFSAETKDNIVKIKPFLITRRKVSRSVRKALREKARNELIKYAKSKTSVEFFKDILKNIVQKKLGSSLKKIYPLSLSEIRIFKIEKPLEKKENPSHKEEIKKEKQN